MRNLIPALLALALTVPAHATTLYLVEPRHTQGVAQWSHMGFSHPTAHFTDVHGTLRFDPKAPTTSSVRVTIPMTAFGTGLPDLDDDFRSPAFFDYPRFPAATFRSTRVEIVDGADHYRITGDLTLHGVTRPVVLDTRLNGAGTNARSGVAAIGFDATTRLKRSDFGLGRFVPIVSDDIDLRITLEANEATSYLDYLRRQVADATTDADRAASAKDLEAVQAEVAAASKD
jgi:polyisoprenoid-binding protein YceI